MGVAGYIQFLLYLLQRLQILGGFPPSSKTIIRLQVILGHLRFKNFLAEKIQKIFELQMTCKPMIVFDTNKEIPYFFIHIPQTATYSNFSNFKRLGKFHHGDGGETIPLKNTCKNKVSPPPPGDGGETYLY